MYCFVNLVQAAAEHAGRSSLWSEESGRDSAPSRDRAGRGGCCSWPPRHDAPPRRPRRRSHLCASQRQAALPTVVARPPGESVYIRAKLRSIATVQAAVNPGAVGSDNELLGEHSCIGRFKYRPIARNRNVNTPCKRLRILFVEDSCCKLPPTSSGRNKHG